jgi:two-component system, chemotaxis family, protein-glutamate methylesterase/glutaminase
MKSDIYTIAQDEATSVVFGMPNEAIKLKAVDKTVPLQDISMAIFQGNLKEGNCS